MSQTRFQDRTETLPSSADAALDEALRGDIEGALGRLHRASAPIHKPGKTTQRAAAGLVLLPGVRWRGR